MTQATKNDEILQRLFAEARLAPPPPLPGPLAARLTLAAKDEQKHAHAKKKAALVGGAALSWRARLRLALGGGWALAGMAGALILGFGIGLVAPQDPFVETLARTTESTFVVFEGRAFETPFDLLLFDE